MISTILHNEDIYHTEYEWLWTPSLGDVNVNTPFDDDHEGPTPWMEYLKISVLDANYDIYVEGQHIVPLHLGEGVAPLWSGGAIYQLNQNITIEGGVGHGNHTDFYKVTLAPFGNDGVLITFSGTHIPEPTTIFLFGIGMISLFGIRARREVIAV